ncbi:MAG: hypothetical protein ACD_43C00277G0005 [uncultured bacterium]|nr:MAG: hypothetical protein ACD_43C00277G0005 [uncultured bacterium]
MKTAIFIGRFQPFHSGHYSVLQDLVEQGYQHIVIGIGSAQYSRTEENPLSAAERRRCIETVFQQQPLAARITIVNIPDIHNDAAWVDHVEKIIYTVTNQYSIIVTGNELVQSLFQTKGKLVQPVKQTVMIAGSQIRLWIRQHQTEWRTYVEPTLADWIEPIILNGHGSSRT